MIKSSATFLQKRASDGYGYEEFQWPVGIAADVSGNVYVFDRDRIQKFDG